MTMLTVCNSFITYLYYWWLFNKLKLSCVGCCMIKKYEMIYMYVISPFLYLKINQEMQVNTNYPFGSVTLHTHSNPWWMIRIRKDEEILIKLYLFGMDDGVVFKNYTYIENAIIMQWSERKPPTHTRFYFTLL